ncbi:unnamed protein product [Blepharisma stoltei]|uniref:Uncharacterized protein n=1 Tax=Blepharisma stoltei TaxID=1481888 RepID=A0AAU9IX19_9CILI|nr:unnamed protein product [Blepharisma stoltei]
MNKHIWMNIPNKLGKLPSKAYRKKSASTRIDSQNKDTSFVLNKKPTLLNFTSLQAARNQVKLKKNYSFSSLQEARYKFKAHKTASISQTTWENIGVLANLDSHEDYQRNSANVIKCSGKECLISHQSSISKSKSLSSLEMENLETDSDTSFCLTPPISYENSEGGDFMDFYSEITFRSSTSQVNSPANNSENVSSNKKTSLNANYAEDKASLIKPQSHEYQASLNMKSAIKIDRHSIELYSNCKDNLKRKNNDDSEVNCRSKRFKFSSSEFAHNNDLYRIDGTN